MRHTLHHLRWLLRRFGVALIFYAAVWAVLGSAVWRVYEYRNSQFPVSAIFGVVYASFPLVGLVILTRAMRQDPAPGTSEFWRTRPPRWRAVWASQAIFAVVFVAGPPLAVWFINGLRLDNTPLQWAYGLIDVALILSPVLALAGMLSLARSWYGQILSIVLAAGCIIGGLLLFWYLRIRDHISYEPDNRVMIASILLGVALVLTLSWVFGMRRPGVLWRTIITAAGLLIVPPLLQSARYSALWTPQVTASATVNPAWGLPRPEGGADYSVMKFQGLPANTIPVINSEGITMHWLHENEVTRAQQSGHHPFYLDLPHAEDFWRRGGRSSAPHAWPDTVGQVWVIPADPLRALFPAGTHWYSSVDKVSLQARGGAGGPFSSTVFDIWRALSSTEQDQPFVLDGASRGWLLTAVSLAAVPLEEGAVGAENGTRLRVLMFRQGPDVLALTVQVWRSGTFSSPVVPSGIATYQDCFRHPYLPVVHLPALNMAVLTGGGTAVRDEFRSWQCTGHTRSVRVDLPAAAKMRGVHFTAENLRGAQLVLCAPVLTSFLTITAPQGEQVLQGFASLSDEAKIFRLLAELNNMEWKSLIAPPDAAKLLSMGAPAVRAVLRYDWSDRIGPLENPESAMVLWLAVTDEFIPDLIAALPKDPRWMKVARLIQKEDRLAPAALDLVRRTQTPLAPAIVSAALLAAQPPDYAALRHHVELALSKNNSDGQFWQRLRSLPDFPWPELARQQWREALDEYESPNDAVRNAALLAGEIGALHAFLDSGFLLRRFDTSEEAAILDRIEGLPQNRAERRDWLRKNRGNLHWDESRGKYRPQN